MLNPFKPSGLFYLNSLDRSISCTRGVWLVFIIIIFYKKKSKFNANSVDPDHTPRPAMSNLDLNCLHISILLNARLKCVNT